MGRDSKHPLTNNNFRAAMGTNQVLPVSQIAPKCSSRLSFRRSVEISRPRDEYEYNQTIYNKNTKNYMIELKLIIIDEGVFDHI